MVRNRNRVPGMGQKNKKPTTDRGRRRVLKFTEYLDNVEARNSQSHPANRAREYGRGPRPSELRAPFKTKVADAWDREQGYKR